MKLIDLPLHDQLNYLYSHYIISFKTEVKRIDGEWESPVVWKIEGKMLDIHCSCEGFDSIEECVIDCITKLKL